MFDTAHRKLRIFTSSEVVDLQRSIYHLAAYIHAVVIWGDNNRWIPATIEQIPSGV